MTDFVWPLNARARLTAALIGALILVIEGTMTSRINRTRPTQRQRQFRRASELDVALDVGVAFSFETMTPTLQHSSSSRPRSSPSACSPLSRRPHFHFDRH